MARNRRHQSAAIRFGPALKAVVLCLLIGGSAVGYVWQKDQIRQLGDRIAQEEQALKVLRQRNEKLQRQLLTLRSPANLERLAEHGPVWAWCALPVPGDPVAGTRPCADIAFGCGESGAVRGEPGGASLVALTL